MALKHAHQDSRQSGDRNDQDKHLSEMLNRRPAKLARGDYLPFTAEGVKQGLERLVRASGLTNATVTDIRRLAGGASKEQFVFTLSDAGASERLVLRTDPIDGVLETSREREFEILQAMQGIVPVPRPLFLDADGSLLGAPGMVTSFVPGGTKPPQAGAGVSGLGTGFSPEWRARLAPQFMETLKKIHAFDFRAANLLHYDIPDADPYQAARFRVNLWSRVWCEGSNTPNPTFAVVESWLRSNLPAAQELVLVHGDFRTGNYLFDGETSAFTGILDWELAHIGDFHEDLAWSLVEIFGARNEAGQHLCSNLLTTEDFIGSYENVTGRSVNRQTLRFYRILLSWSVIAMCGTALTAADNRHNHQDILLTWLSMVTPPLTDEVTRLLLEEAAI